MLKGVWEKIRLVIIQTLYFNLCFKPKLSHPSPPHSSVSLPAFLLKTLPSPKRADVIIERSLKDKECPPIPRCQNALHHHSPNPADYWLVLLLQGAKVLLSLLRGATEIVNQMLGRCDGKWWSGVIIRSAICYDKSA